jgi:hypothetical protein
MRPLKPVCCLLVVVLLVGSLAFPVFAERPGIIEIRDKFMWGDPDSPAGCRTVGVRQRVVNEPLDYAQTRARPESRSALSNHVDALGLRMTYLRLEVMWLQAWGGHTCMTEIYVRDTRR